MHNATYDRGKTGNAFVYWNNTVFCFEYLFISTHWHNKHSTFYSGYTWPKRIENKFLYIIWHFYRIFLIQPFQIMILINIVKCIRNSNNQLVTKIICQQNLNSSIEISAVSKLYHEKSKNGKFRVLNQFHLIIVFSVGLST